MHDVTIIGLGPMGQALARSLLSAGQRVVVWNRSAGPADALQRAGATLATSVEDAFRRGSLVVLCVRDYAASQEVLQTVLQTPGGRDLLMHKTLVQLSTGSPQQARDLAHWALEHGLSYLDGAIMAVPSQMGGPESTILVSGSTAAYRQSQRALEAMAGNVNHLGEVVGAAAALDFAILSYLFGTLLGFYHGVSICEAEEIELGAYGALLGAIAPTIHQMIEQEREIIASGQYGQPQSSLVMASRASEVILQQAREAGIDDAFPAYVTRTLERARAAGYGDEAIASVVKTLRRTTPSATASPARSPS